MSSVDEAIAQVPGTVGLAARHFDSGARIRHSADMPFFTASTFKVPLLVELLRQVDHGTIDLSQRVELTDAMRVPGSGVLKELEAGLRPTILDLAMLMIIISDNAATDYLYELVGRDSLSAAMRELGLTQTRIPMSCRELLYTLVGLDPADPDITYAMASEKLRGEQIDLDADALDEAKSDVSSPDDMCALFEAVHRGDLLSPVVEGDVLGHPEAPAAQHGHPAAAASGHGRREQDRQLPLRAMRRGRRPLPVRALRRRHHGQAGRRRAAPRRPGPGQRIQGSLRRVQTRSATRTGAAVW